GIGLVLTKRLVELMGGSLSVTSTPGVGTVFSIELEATEAESQAARAEPVETGTDRSASESATMTVLCVEDNPVSLKLIEEVVGAREGIRLLTAANGRDGLAVARARLPDVILMDNNMPVMSGREAQRLLSADPRTANIPVIAISANAMTGAVAEGLAAGYFRYLTKPVDLGDLRRALDDALALAMQRRPPA